MNRIVLVGNGFDLAHNLPTKYEDFINWYWEQRMNSLQHEYSTKSEDAITSLIVHAIYGNWNEIYNQNKNLRNKKELLNWIKNNPEFFRIKKSTFFERICKSIETKGWVDIENEYYNYLIDIYKQKTFDYTVENLNRELGFIRQKLSEYLTTIENEQQNNNIQIKEIRKQILSPIKLNDIAIKSQYQFNEFIESRIAQDKPFWYDLIESYGLQYDMFLFWNDISSLKSRIENTGTQKDRDFIYETFAPKDFLLPDNIMILNFNYTALADSYFPTTNKRCMVNHIHGNLTNSDSIIFGYGDELDDKYKQIKELNDNEYLRFFKSTRYLEMDNYRKILSFIESAPFQVLIMGHSCGNSDRTLLNTLFEHDNCVSIKPYYYQKENGTDNYIDLIQNISRNFTDMKKMRDRVVNKTYCEPLSQVKQ